MECCKMENVFRILDRRGNVLAVIEAAENPETEVLKILGLRVQKVRETLAEEGDRAQAA